MPVDLVHKHLLKACLSQTRLDFSQHLMKWETAQNLQEIDPASARLIPFLYRKAESFGVEIKNYGICRGIYLKAWYQYSLVSALPRKTLVNDALFDKAVLLKGAALQQGVYSLDPPTRPADDVDILIPRGENLKVLQKLIERGFWLDSPISSESLVKLRNSAGLRRGQDHFDIHWSVFPICLDPLFTERLVSRSLRGKDGLRYSSPVDSLLHTIVHGFGSNEIAPIRWILDAGLLIRSGEIDWVTFRQEVSATGWSTIVYPQMTVLQSEYGVKVPPEAYGPKMTSYLITIARIYLKTDSVWLRRFLRLFGWDFAVFAQNQGFRPTLRMAIVSTPKLTLYFIRELREVLSSYLRQ